MVLLQIKKKLERIDRSNEHINKLVERGLHVPPPPEEDKEEEEKREKKH